MNQDGVRLDIAKKALALLRREMKGRGHGTIAGVQRALGLRRTYFSENRPRLELALVIQVLRELDIRPGKFFDELEGYEPDLERIPDKVPEGLEVIADYYRSGKYLEETDDDS